MVAFFKRIFKVAQSEAHSAVDQFENPIKLTEQGIRDLKQDLTSSMQSLAEVKALVIQLTQQQQQAHNVATGYERKAMQLLQKSQQGALDAGTADRLAAEALQQKEQAVQQASHLQQQLTQQAQAASQLDSNVRKLKTQIGSWENELTTLRSRAKVASATKKLNKQLAQVDSSGTLSMLEKMRTKVAEDEALAQSYGDMAQLDTHIDDEIERALQQPSEAANSDALAALKARMKLAAS